MKYTSTRGGVKEATFEQALFSGYAFDGGLFLPQQIPVLSTEKLKEFSKLSFPDLAREILSLFITNEEIPRNDLDDIVTKAFSRFDTREVVTLAKLGDGLNILELWHGPTLAFKDLALSVVGLLIEYFLNKRKKHVIIIVGTSGDTGSAAIESVRGSEWVDIVVLLPRGRCSRVQELQMTTVLEDNVHIYRVDGTSDDLDAPIKEVFMDHKFAETHQLISINSINWARIMVQITHYFYAYFKVALEWGETVEIVVPTGACGNVTSGVIARQMGLPIQLVTAVNVNDIVARTVRKGDFSASDAVQPTLASAMDIQVPYNMERLFYLFAGGNHDQVAALMHNMETEDCVRVPSSLHDAMASCLKSCVVDDGDIQATMAKCWKDNNYLLCPHTAIAVKYFYDNRDEDIRRVCLATASAAKFEEAVISAGLPPQSTDAVKSLFSMPTRYKDMEKGEDWGSILREALQDIVVARQNSLKPSASC